MRFPEFNEFTEIPVPFKENWSNIANCQDVFNFMLITSCFADITHAKLIIEYYIFQCTCHCIWLNQGIDNVFLRISFPLVT